MISKVLNDINGVAIYPVATLIIFFSIFGFMLVKVMLRKKSDDAEMAQLPLQDSVVNIREADRG